MLQLVLSLNAGGTERLVLELVTALQAEVPMAVCCLDERGVWADRLTAGGVTVTALRRAPGFRPGLARQIAEMASRHAASVIHCHHYSPFVYGALSRMWRPASRLLFTEHGRLVNQRPTRKRALANLMLSRLTHATFAVSDDVRSHLREEGFRRDSVGVISNGIDVGPAPTVAQRQRVRDELAVKPNTMVVGSIARLDPVKDLGTLIGAMSMVARQTSALLLIIGDGPERARLEALVAETGCGPHVRFLGHRDDARGWLAGCDVYVNCSLSEGASLTILEAMAAGLPVVATRVGGNPEVVTPDCGMLVEARDADALGAALLEMARNPVSRATLGVAARARVLERFSLDRMIARYRELYVSLS